ncbi:MAG: translation initiation factor IF-3 [Candidatus Omnitrophota bacterium]
MFYAIRNTQYARRTTQYARRITQYARQKKEVIAIRKFIRVNERIRVPEVRVIGSEGEQLGVVTIKRALEMAAQNELDLVEVAPTAQPPVCRIMDYSKYKYDQEKKEREAKKHQNLMHLKEIRFKPRIEDHDYRTKVDHLLSFLKKGDKVKVTLMFRGREMAHKELGRRIIDRVIADSAVAATVEKEPTMERRMIIAVLSPKGKEVKQTK